MAVIKTKSIATHTQKSAKSRLINSTQWQPKSTEASETSSSKSLVSSISAFQALTAAALVLPGLMLAPPCTAEDDEMGFQYSHYQETKRNLYDVPNNTKPIQVDSIQGGTKVSLTDRLKFALNYTQDTWSGATPITTAPLIFAGNHPITTNNITTGASPLITGGLMVDKNNNYAPVKQVGLEDNGVIPIYQNNSQLVHTISVASPETRKQGDLKLTYEWDEAALDVGGGTSVERDYQSNFGNVGGRWDFNQKLNSLNLGLSYTNSNTNALIDYDANTYIDKNAYLASGQLHPSPTTGTRLQANRQDWGTNLGLTQILTENSLLQGTVGYTRGTGYMANPYKVMEVLFVDPNQIPNADTGYINPFGDGRNFFGDGTPENIVIADVKAFLEKRPDLRNQWNLGSRYVQYLSLLDAALHFDYHFSTDDWGINAHTFEADWVQPVGFGWTVTPRVRYYSQDAAYFYKPYLLINQKSTPGTTAIPSNDYQKLPDSYSSDQRLSAYGALSGGISISKQFAKGVTLETGFEYYTHAGSLKLGGGGEGDYANFNYYVANAALKVNLSALGHGGLGDHSQHEHHHHGAPIPAGVMFAHMMEKTGEFMVGYRYMYSTQAGNMLHGSNHVADQTIVDQGCGANDQCLLTAKSMNMHMHMLDLMYAPVDWLNLMLMPQFVDMNMSMRVPDGAPYNMMSNDHVNTGMSTGGVGDTGMYALFKLLGTPDHRINMSLGITAPTGNVGLQMRHTMGQESHGGMVAIPGTSGGFYDYGMQLGSGTWDFKPSMTYTGNYDDWSWGAQVNGTKRLENKNESGYALGDIIQSTAWSSYQLLNWLSTSVRGVYTVQGGVKGEYNGFIDKMGPTDYPQNYGGKYWDVGFGINAFVPSGNLVGNNLSFEWLQPVSTDVNGYQLNRDGALAATWSYMF